MLRLLLDEHISPAVGLGLRDEMVVQSLGDWEAGQYLSCSDEKILGAAFRMKFTLVTYDRRTIPPLLKLWGESGESHGGVIFVDTKTIPSGDIGGLIRGLEKIWRNLGREDWTNRVVFLTRG